MTGAGAPDQRPVDCHDLRVAILAASWHQTVMDGLVEGAQRACRDHKVEAPHLVRVPGTFELPVVADALAAQGYDAVVALGVVIRGGTPSMRKWRNWQTHQLEGLAIARLWGFESPLPHQSHQRLRRARLNVGDGVSSRMSTPRPGSTSPRTSRSTPATSCSRAAA